MYIIYISIGCRTNIYILFSDSFVRTKQTPRTYLKDIIYIGFFLLSKSLRWTLLIPLSLKKAIVKIRVRRENIKENI